MAWTKEFIFSFGFEHKYFSFLAGFGQKRKARRRRGVEVVYGWIWAENEMARGRKG